MISVQYSFDVWAVHSMKMDPFGADYLVGWPVLELAQFQCCSRVDWAGWADGVGLDPLGSASHQSLHIALQHLRVPPQTCAPPDDPVHTYLLNGK